MIKIGMTVADRYEVLEKIGTGGMSDVYRAKDHKLNRHVAVKVLKQEFSENKDFLQKFRSEAQSAAGLMHPNIVNVYDVGEDSGSHYIVMELVEGITLKKYIEKKARLSVREAVSIAIQVAQGIEAAHNNHIIHRDIKPQNVIISMDGKVKVTDFGIAKAATSNTITSNVMGSVHYTSPEQVRGGFSDEKSDIYSLGITLFEMLTGRVPFNGDTTVAVAIKHIQEPMPSPRDYVPEIPVSLEKIVLKCTQKSPDRRYQSAPELIEDLKRSLISPDEDFVKLDENDEHGATKDISPQEIKRIRQQANRRDSFDAQMMAGAAGANGQDEYQEEYPEGYEEGDPEYEGQYPEYEGEYPEYEGEYPEYEGEYPEYEGEYPEGYDPDNQDPYANGPVLQEIISGRKKNNEPPANHRKKKKKKRPAEADKNSQRNGNNGNRRPTAPDVPRKKSQGQPSARKSDTRRRKRSRDDRYDENDPRMEILTTILIIIAAVILAIIFLYIVWQAIGFGREKENPTSAAPTSAAAAEATPTTAVGNTEKGTLPVPDVVGRSRPEARKLLEDDSFDVEVQNLNDDEVEKGNVIRQEPEAGTYAAIGSKVTIYISLGKELIQVAMPDLKGHTEEEAKLILENAGLSATKGEDEYSDNYEEGKVCYQNYSAGTTISTDSEIEYRISKGRENAIYMLDNYFVDAPEGYQGGEATIYLKDEAGGQIWAENTSSFPVSIQVTGIANIPRGVLTIEFTMMEEQEVSDEDGNTFTQQVETRKTSQPKSVEFKKVAQNI